MGFSAGNAEVEAVDGKTGRGKDRSDCTRYSACPLDTVVSVKGMVRGYGAQGTHEERDA